MYHQRHEGLNLQPPAARLPEFSRCVLKVTTTGAVRVSMRSKYDFDVRLVSNPSAAAATRTTPDSRSPPIDECGRHPLKVVAAIAAGLVTRRSPLEA